MNVYFGQRAGLLTWPFLAAAVILAFGAWWLYQLDGAEASLLRAAGASILISIAVSSSRGKASASLPLKAPRPLRTISRRSTPRPPDRVLSDS